MAYTVTIIGSRASPDSRSKPSQKPTNRPITTDNTKAMANARMVSKRCILKSSPVTSCAV